MISKIIETMELLKSYEQFKDLSDKELQYLAVECIKVATIKNAGNAISNAVNHINKGY